MSLQDSINGRDDDLRPSRSIAVLGTFNVRDGDVCQGADAVAPGCFHVQDDDVCLIGETVLQDSLGADIVGLGSVNV